MRITEINATNYLSHRALSIAIEPDTRVLLIAGPNGAGKSAVGQAVQLALTGEPVRGLELKNQLGQLIRQGETAGSVSVALTDGDVVEVGGEYVYTVNLKSGTRTAKAMSEGGTPPTIPVLALDPAEFLRLDMKARQKEMFRLAGVRMSTTDIEKALLDAGHDAERVTRACKYLRLGFEAAVKEAREAATEARGAWKALTGETYGEVKADTWRAPVEKTAPGGSIDELRTQLEDAKAAVEKARERHHKIQAAEEATRSVTKLTEAANGLREARARVTIAEREAADAAAEVDRANKAAEYRGGVSEPCPACGVVLMRDGSGRLIEAKDVPRSMEEINAAKAALELARKNADVATQRLNQARRAVADGEAAGEALKSMPERPTEEAIEASKRAFNVAQATLSSVQVDYDLAVRDQDAAAHAEALTEQAKARHLDVTAFVRLADAIEALPGEFLSTVVAKVNALLAEAAAAFDAPIVVGTDMAPLYGTIPYALCSESQQWRVRAAVGYAIAVLSGIGILMLDRFDVLEPKARGPLLKFLSGQQKAQVLLMGTLKERPRLPKPFAVEWLG